MFLRHYLGEGWSTSLSIPTGTVRFDPGTGLSAGQRSGFGDVQVDSRYDFSALWGQSMERPSLEVNLGLALPTGKQETIGSLSPSFPPQIVGIGRAVFSFVLGIDYTQFLHESFALKAKFALSQPMTETSQSILFGPAYSYGVGGLFLHDDDVFYSGQLVGDVQMPSLKSGVDITNSGSHVFGLDAAIGKKMTDKVSLVAQLHVPLYIGTQGTQVAESFTLSGAVTMSFGGQDDDHGHSKEDASSADEHGHGHSHVSPETEEDEAPASLQSSEIERLKAEITRLKAQNQSGVSAPVADKSSSVSEESSKKPTPVPTPVTSKSPTKKSRFAVRVEEPTEKAKVESKPELVKTVQSTPVASQETNTPLSTKPDIRDLARGGKSFALKDAPVSGKITVIDFWADWCRPCKKITAMLTELAAENPNLAIRKVEVPNFESAVAVQYLANVSGLPVVWIYSADGQVSQKLTGTTDRAVRKTLKTLLSK